MIGVGGIIIWREHGGEQIAGSATNVAQERRLGWVAAPVAQHRNPAAIGQAKSEDIDRIGGGMLAEAAFGPAVHAAATIAAGMVDPDDAAFEVTNRGGLDDFAFP